MKRQPPKRSPGPQEVLVIRSGNGAPLSKTQEEFNRLIKSLAQTKARHVCEQARLDESLITASRELMPLVERRSRLERDLISQAYQFMQTLKLSPQRRLWLTDLLCRKAENLLEDPTGLSAEDSENLRTIIQKLNPEADAQTTADLHRKFHETRAMYENLAHQAGLDLDLSDLDPDGDPEDFSRIVQERLHAAREKRADSPTAEKPTRQPTKAQAEKQRKRAELENAKNRDLKSLFKQLAKALHPDLEPDPTLKEHKKVWMQRLNAAYAADDLREMLQLEVEWLGEEATNLANAGDEKLQVYCMVLKEQIAELKQQIIRLSYEPQYRPLMRFRNAYDGAIANFVAMKRRLSSEVRGHAKMLDTLSARNASSRQLIYQWADEHGYRSMNEI
jgi:hypothetical protein